MGGLQRRPLTKSYTSVILLAMKTAVSLPNILYEKAEKTALYMGIPRSKLFSMALTEFIERHNGQIITEKINEAYEKINQNEFTQCLDVGLESLRDLTRNDSW